MLEELVRNLRHVSSTTGHTLSELVVMVVTVSGESRHLQ